MDKKTYAPLYVIQCDSMTGVMGRSLIKGQAYPPIAFMNLDDHIAAGDVLDKEIHDHNVEVRLEQERAQLKKDEEEIAK